MELHLQETAQLVKLERIECEKSVASLGLDTVIHTNEQSFSTFTLHCRKHPAWKSDKFSSAWFLSRTNISSVFNK